MAGINEDRARQVVPLWRNCQTTTSRGELASVAAADTSRFSDSMLDSLRQEWEVTPVLSVASDLVSAALTLGRFNVARKAAETILADSSATRSARDVAELYLNNGKRPSRHECGPHVIDPPGLTLQQQLHVGVSKAKRQLIVYPRNPVLWSNLALIYTSLGLREKAEKAIRAALALAPENRFILRSASRFYLHAGDRQKAHCILADASIVRIDPWVLSAEIATAAAVGRASSNIKIARKLLDSRRHSPFHLSELASALGTLESLSGNLRVARPLVSQSLQDPAENSIAQAAWLYRNVGGIGRETGQTFSFEANAWFASRSTNWGASLSETKRWQLEQPFSSRPAVFGSYIASVALGDYAEAATFAKLGLLGNPDDFSLQNNAAFSLALSGDVDEAARTIRRVSQTRITEHERVALAATQGLIAFRSSDAIAGRSLYREAIALGRKLGVASEHVARIYYALEELRIGGLESEAIRKEALENAVHLPGPEYRRLIEKLRGAVSAPR